MDRRSFLNKHSYPEFKRKVGSRRGNLSSSSRDQFENDSSADTVYRILCESKKIGSVIGKGGIIVRALREETRSKITVTDSVPGSDERVIIIYSPPTRIKRDDNGEGHDPGTEREKNPFELHCAAQDALLKVHERIIEEDIGGKGKDDNKEIVVSARLLVPNIMVGCLLGKKGDVIQRLRSETGASIRVLSSEHLPSCAMNTDELVQISGNPAVVKRALYEVSTRLHLSPKKDQPPLGPPMPHGRHGYYPPGPPLHSFSPPSNPVWSPKLPYYRDAPSAWIEGGFDGGPPMDREEAPKEFSMKILCSAAKIGGVIGKGGSNVRQLEQETGAGIHVEDASSESEERVIRVSSFEVPWGPLSQTIEAILLLQDKTSDVSEKGIIITRLLVPSNKVGCLLGQGGQVINEMRRRTHADIRVLTKEDKPKWAASDVELVQISGNFRVAKDALAEISSRLRDRVFQGADGGAERDLARPVRGFGPSGRLHVDEFNTPGPLRAGGPGPMRAGGPAPLRAGGPAPMRAGGFSGYEGGRRDYEHRSYPVHSSEDRYPNINSRMEGRMVNHTVGSALADINRDEIAEPRWKLQDHQSVGPDEEAEFRGSSGHSSAAPRSTHYDYTAPPGEYANPPPDYYRSHPHTQLSTYPSTDTPLSTYLNINTPETTYEKINPQHAPYQNHMGRDPYPATYEGSYQF